MKKSLMGAVQADAIGLAVIYNPTALLLRDLESDSPDLSFCDIVCNTQQCPCLRLIRLVFLVGSKEASNDTKTHDVPLERGELVGA